MSSAVIASTVKEARSIARGLSQSGAHAMSPRSIERFGAGRGLVVDDILVDRSALPLSAKVQQLVDIWVTRGARVHLRTPAN